MEMAPVLWGRLLRTARYGIYGSGHCDVFWTGGGRRSALIDRSGNDLILQWVVLCPTGESRSRQGLARTGVRRMRVERERELRRRRKRHEKARKERRKVALMQAGKWPLTPIKA
jgi:hypothetical protein